MTFENMWNSGAISWRFDNLSITANHANQSSDPQILCTYVTDTCNCNFCLIDFQYLGLLKDQFLKKMLLKEQKPVAFVSQDFWLK